MNIARRPEKSPEKSPVASGAVSPSLMNQYYQWPTGLSDEF
jgi:hypothetical protein